MLKAGDKVKVIKGEYEGLEGTVIKRIAGYVKADEMTAYPIYTYDVVLVRLYGRTHEIAVSDVEEKAS